MGDELKTLSALAAFAKDENREKLRANKRREEVLIKQQKKQLRREELLEQELAEKHKHAAIIVLAREQTTNMRKQFAKDAWLSRSHMKERRIKTDKDFERLQHRKRGQFQQACALRTEKHRAFFALRDPESSHSATRPKRPKSAKRRPKSARAWGERSTGHQQQLGSTAQPHYGDWGSLTSRTSWSAVSYSSQHSPSPRSAASQPLPYTRRSPTSQSVATPSAVREAYTGTGSAAEPMEPMVACVTFQAMSMSSVSFHNVSSHGATSSLELLRELLQDDGAKGVGGEEHLALNLDRVVADPRRDVPALIQAALESGGHTLLARWPSTDAVPAIPTYLRRRGICGGGAFTSGWEVRMEPPCEGVQIHLARARWILPKDSHHLLVILSPPAALPALPPPIRALPQPPSVEERLEEMQRKLDEERAEMEERMKKLVADEVRKKESEVKRLRARLRELEKAAKGSTVEKEAAAQLSQENAELKAKLATLGAAGGGKTKRRESVCGTQNPTSVLAMDSTKVTISPGGQEEEELWNKMSDGAHAEWACESAVWNKMNSSMHESVLPPTVMQGGPVGHERPVDAATTCGQAAGVKSEGVDSQQRTTQEATGREGAAEELTMDRALQEKGDAGKVVVEEREQAAALEDWLGKGDGEVEHDSCEVEHNNAGASSSAKEHASSLMAHMMASTKSQAVPKVSPPPALHVPEPEAGLEGEKEDSTYECAKDQASSMIAPLVVSIDSQKSQAAAKAPPPPPHEPEPSSPDGNKEQILQRILELEQMMGEVSGS